jgi:mannose-1-phosphate guanylyltransferase
VRAVVLVGGEGTRLRPLTETIPKPLIPLVDRPFLHHVLDHLAAHGVETALLSSPYLQDAFAPVLAERSGGPEVTWITEERPLGTGGAIANALRGSSGPVLALNGDILTDLDLTALVGAHRERGATATIALTPVEDARPYGLVDLDGDGRVLAFREKPADPGPGLINAGTYVLQAEALSEVPEGVAVSIEREIFPSLIDAGRVVVGFPSSAYWMDLGRPDTYLQATFDALAGRVGGLSYTAPHVDPTATVSLRAHLGSWVVVGPGATVGDGAEVEDSVLLAGVRVGREAVVRDTIAGPRADIGDGARVEGAVLAEGAVVPSGSRTEGARVSAGQVLEG